MNPMCDISHGEFYLLSQPGQLMLKTKKMKKKQCPSANRKSTHPRPYFFLLLLSLLPFPSIFFSSTFSTLFFFFLLLLPLTPVVGVLREREMRACTSGPHTFALMMYCPAEEFHLLWLASAEPVASH